MPFAIAGRLCEDLRRQISAEEVLRQWEASKTLVHPQLNQIVREVFHNPKKTENPDITPKQRTFYARRLTEEWEALFMPKPEDAAGKAIHELSSKDERFVLGTLDKVSKEIVGNLKDLLTMRERASRRLSDASRELRNLPEDDSHIGQMVTDFNKNRQLKEDLNKDAGKLEDEYNRLQLDLTSTQEKIKNLKAKLGVAKQKQVQVSLAKKLRTAVQDYEKRLQRQKLADSKNTRPKCIGDWQENKISSAK